MHKICKMTDAGDIEWTTSPTTTPNILDASISSLVKCTKIGMKELNRTNLVVASTSENICGIRD